MDRTYRRVADHLQHVSIRSAEGQEQTLHTTDEHPFYVVGKGWTKAQELEAGDLLQDSDGSTSMVLSSIREEHPEGVAVFNLRVANTRSYFVRAEGSTAEPVWVHNACVYRSVEDSTVRYVGIADRGATPSLASRLAAAEIRTPDAATAVIEGAENVTPLEAEQMEQALISYYGRTGVEPGGTLVNINAGVNVSPTNTAAGFKKLADIGYWRSGANSVESGGSGI